MRSRGTPVKSAWWPKALLLLFALLLLLFAWILKPNLFRILWLILLSGGLAFAGDWVGRRIGKKRLTWWGLRPRDTAVIITMFTGMIIAGLIMATMILTSRDVRVAFFHLTEIQQRNRELGDRNRLLEKRNASLVARRRDLEGQVEGAHRNLEATKQQLARARAQLTQAHQRLRVAQADVKRKARQVQTLDADKQALDRNLIATRERLATARQNLEQAQRELKGIERELRDTEEELGGTQAELEETWAELEEAQAEIENAIEVLQKEEQQLRRVEEERKRLEAQGQLLAQIVLQAEEILAGAQQPLIYRAGEELVKGTLQGGQAAASIRQELQRLLAEASAQAQARGARPRADGLCVTAERIIFTEPGPLVLSENAVIGGIAEALSRRAGSFVARAVAANNTVEGQLVHVEFELYDNHVVFRRGEEIARATIDGARPDHEIFSALMNLLQNDVRAAAIQQGLLPTQPGGRFGSITPAELFPVLHEIEAHGRPVRVRVRAATDVWTADPLQIELGVEYP